jgi:hypothetical protein
MIHTDPIDFELEDLDGTTRRLSELRGRPVVLTVAGRVSGEAAGRFAAALAPRLAPSDTAFVTVADTSGVPRLVRGVVRHTIRSGIERTQREAARESPDLPPNTWDRFVFLLDWDGAALDCLTLRGQTARFHVLVIDRQGREQGRLVQGDAPQPEQIEAVARWLKTC